MFLKTLFSIVILCLLPVLESKATHKQVEHLPDGTEIIIEKGHELPEPPNVLDPIPEEVKHKHEHEHKKPEVADDHKHEEKPEVPAEHKHEQEVAAAAEHKPEVDLSTFCKASGLFPNPNDPTNETFIRCQLEPIELTCLNGYYFDQEQQTCVSNAAERFDELHDRWTQLLDCPVGVKDAFYRNKYDCNMFYRCYTQGEFHRIAVHYCLPEMIFDEKLKTCVTKKQFHAYNHHECKAEPLPENHELLEPSQENLDREQYRTEFQLNKVLAKLRSIFY